MQQVGRVRVILQENLKLKLKIKDLEIKNSHLFDDVILRGTSRIQRTEGNYIDFDPLDEILFPRNKKHSQSLRNNKPLGTTQSNGCQVVRPRGPCSPIQRESLSTVSADS